MKFLVRTSNGQVTPCNDEAAATLLENDPSCQIAKFGTNHWIRGETFLEFGGIAFDSQEFRVHLDQPDPSQTDLLVTTETFPPYTVAARLGVVVAERVAGINVLKEMVIGMTDLVGGSSGTLQNELSHARREVIADLKRQASSMGAHGLIALNLTYSPFEAKNTMMLMVAGWATAVTFSGRSEA